MACLGVVKIIIWEAEDGEHKSHENFNVALHKEPNNAVTSHGSIILIVLASYHYSSKIINNS